MVSVDVLFSYIFEASIIKIRINVERSDFLDNETYERLKNDVCDFLEVTIENIVERLEGKIEKQSEYMKGIVELLESALRK